MNSHAVSAPAPLDQVPDDMGQELQKQMIWAAPDVRLTSAFVAFRKKFSIDAPFQEAKLYLFADVRYLLWINGQYVLRGPARFNPNGPEYDVMELKGQLRAGENEVVVLVLADQSNGKMMHHAPGLTLRIDGTNFGRTTTVLSTDDTWKWSDRTRYRNPRVDWGNVDDVIDSTIEDGDWTKSAYNDDAWQAPVKVDGEKWGALSARRIPLLRATPIKIKLENDRQFPIILSEGQEVVFHLDRLVQAYTVIDFDADPGTTLELPYAGITYKAKPGRQNYITSDTHGFVDGSLKVTSGKITLYSFQPIELLYPFDCLGSFSSNDPLLDKLWSVCTRSLQVLSEDAYVDCADRERTEWMDNVPADFDVTRVAMAGPGENGAKIPADPRLLKELLRRTAQTLQPDGWVKAHTCSDRFDIHAKMEDRACDWVEQARIYYESCGDKDLIREIWPAITAQMQYFLDRRSSRGLVIGREWVIWRNPMGYQTSEGAGLNAFVYKALVDAAFLGSVIGKTDDAAKFEQAAQDLSLAFNKVLWNEKDGTYYSGYDTEIGQLPSGVDNDSVRLSYPDWHLPPKPPTLANHLIASTVYPALFALDQGIVPADRLDKVRNYLFSQPDPHPRIMFYYYYFKQLYELNQPGLDENILDTIRVKWKDQANWRWQTTWEELNGDGSRAHGYGMFPAYFLSSYVLGVRREEATANNHLIINPRLGNLTRAEGTVMTEFGPVTVSWKQGSDHLDFNFEVPRGITASLELPSHGGEAHLVLDGRSINTRSGDISDIRVEIKSGAHQGTLSFPSSPVSAVH